MNKEQLNEIIKQYLKENLTIDVEIGYNSTGEKCVEVITKIEDEIIYRSYDILDRDNND